MSPNPTPLERLRHHPETRRFGKFAIVGMINTAIDMAVYILLHSVLGMHYLLANIFAFLAAAINSYNLNRRWTFRSTAADWRREMTQYLAVIGLGFCLNEGLLYILVDRFSLHSIVAKVLVIGVVLVWNFGANRWWTFRKSLPV